MKKVLVLVVVLVLLASLQTLAGFQESRWQIIDQLANDDSYRVSKTSWERTDLRDGTPRWLSTVKNKYLYELIGMPILQATLNGELGGTEESGFELASRIINFLEAVGVAEGKAQEVCRTLFSATVADPGVKYYLVSGKIRIELVYYDVMGTFMVVLKKG